MNESEIPDGQFAEVPESEPQPLLPVCPHCGSTPFIPNPLPFNSAPQPGLPQIRMLIICCAQQDCRKVITVFMLPAMPPRIAVPGAGPHFARTQ